MYNISRHARQRWRTRVGDDYDIRDALSDIVPVPRRIWKRAMQPKHGGASRGVGYWSPRYWVVFIIRDTFVVTVLKARPDGKLVTSQHPWTPPIKENNHA